MSLIDHLKKKYTDEEIKKMLRHSALTSVMIELDKADEAWADVKSQLDVLAKEIKEWN